MGCRDGVAIARGTAARHPGAEHPGHPCAVLAVAVHTAEQLERLLHAGGRVRARMLQREYAEGQTMPRAPRLLSRVVEGEELVESLLAGAVIIVARPAVRALGQACLLSGTVDAVP